MSKTVYHKADTRGVANLGWLESRHTFSFSHYHHPDRMNFGALRVLNDDIMAPGMGFGKHPHSNMEIISIPLQGDLQHEDSMGNKTIIRKGDIQIMSAGSGVTHSEFNANKDSQAKFLQIWVIPNRQDQPPRYDQITLKDEDRRNKLQQIVAPSPEGHGVPIRQDAWFHLASLEHGSALKYDLKKKTNGLYAFVLEGEVQIENQELKTRDGFGIWDFESTTITAIKNAEVLLMEVPMQY